METKKTFTTEAVITIAIEDLEKYCKERNIRMNTRFEKRCALSTFIEDAMEDKDVDLAYFSAY